MKLYLIRHGETEWNKERRLQGRTDVSLNETGREQVMRLRDEIREMEFDVCIASPLKRAHETAEILVGGKCPIIFDERLVERDFGEFEKMKIADWHELTQNVDVWDCRTNWGEKGFESVNAILARAKDFLDDVLRKYPADSRVMVVAHGSLLKALHYNIVGYANETDFSEFHFENAEMKEYEI